MNLIIEEFPFRMSVKALKISTHTLRAKNVIGKKPCKLNKSVSIESPDSFAPISISKQFKTSTELTLN